MTIFYDNFWCHFWSQLLMTISYDYFWLFLTIFDNFDSFWKFWKDSPGGLWHWLRHWLQFWQLRTWIHDNHCYMTINCDTMNSICNSWGVCVLCVIMKGLDLSEFWFWNYIPTCNPACGLGTEWAESDISWFSSGKVMMHDSLYVGRRADLQMYLLQLVWKISEFRN